MWVEDGDDVTQAVAVLTQQVAKLLLELDFALQAIIIFQGFELGKLSCELLLKGTEFCEARHLTLL
ncbi:hypothetical protein D3C76_1548850 [compost metagenome]